MKNSLFDTEKIRPLFDKVSEKELIANFKKCLFPDALKNLRNLKALGKVLLFSSYGKYKDYQIIKVKETGLHKAVGQKNILLFEDKHLHLSKTIKKLFKQGFDQIFIIDDRATVLEEAHKIDEKIVGILISYGKYKD